MFISIKIYKKNLSVGFHQLYVLSIIKALQAVVLEKEYVIHGVL